MRLSIVPVWNFGCWRGTRQHYDPRFPFQTTALRTLILAFGPIRVTW